MLGLRIADNRCGLPLLPAPEAAGTGLVLFLARGGLLPALAVFYVRISVPFCRRC